MKHRSSKSDRIPLIGWQKILSLLLLLIVIVLVIVPSARSEPLPPSAFPLPPSPYLPVVGDGGYTGPAHWEAPIRAEMLRQMKRIRIPYAERPQIARDLHLIVTECPATGRNPDGPFSCDPSCTGYRQCIHGLNVSIMGWGYSQYLLIAGGAAGVTSHEVWHWTTRQFSTDQRGYISPGHYKEYWFPHLKKWVRSSSVVRVPRLWRLFPVRSRPFESVLCGVGSTP